MSSAADTPQAYLDGVITFLGHPFKVTPDVLIPRFETEQLVQETIKLQPASVVDVGTGSGCIAVSLARSLPQTQIFATDISEKALEIAKQNAHDFPITFLQSFLLDGLTINPEIIVANLPYIPTERIPALDAGVKDFEPILALDGGSDGFDMYRKLFAQIAAKHLTPKYLLAEIDDTQGSVGLAEVHQTFPEARVEVLVDLFGRDRILKITF